MALAAAIAVPALSAAPPARPLGTLDEVARGYVELVLGIGEHDANYVDAYYGPEETRAQVRLAKADLASLARRAGELVAAVEGLPPPAEGAGDTALVTLRRDYLLHQLRSAAVRIAALLDGLMATPGGAALPTGVPLRDRIEALRARVTIPPERIGAVFDRAINECRARTSARVVLPEGESFTVEPVTDKPWGAYNWYQGRYRSVIQVNVSLPISIDRVVDLACHEGYPGHHVYNALLERSLVRGRGWPEFQVYPLYSPQSLIAEGTANYGVALAFPPEERLAFERDVLYVLAGLEPALAAPYARLRELIEGLSYADNEAARRYLDGEIDSVAAASWLERYALVSPERAAQKVRFFDTYRSYVINYNLGEDLVRAHVEARAGVGGDAGTLAERKWAAFVELISSPRLPAALEGASPK